MSDDNQKLVKFDDFLNTGHDREIRDYFTNNRNKNFSCIYLSQSWFNTDKTIRMNASHCCIFEFLSTNEQSLICPENGVSKNDYKKETQEPYSFLYIAKKIHKEKLQ